MATKTRTSETEVNVTEFLNHYVEDEQKKEDSFRLIALLRKWSGFEPKMWGPTIIGFGSYHYKYASGHEGDSPILGFSPRKAAFSLYIYSSTAESKNLLNDLGKFRMGKACIYIRRLSDVNIKTLEQLSRISIAYVNEHHECACREGK
jgi:hypothetical protein